MSKTSQILSLFLLFTIPAVVPTASALEGEAKEKPGLRKIQLVTDIDAITAGEPFTVALVIDPLPGHHTYWRGPGIVGVATNFQWTLPSGFTLGEVMWPPPQKVIMAGITAYGYRDRQMILTSIHPPREIDSDVITLRARIAWMACATSCNPGVDDFTLTIPVHRTRRELTKDALLSAAFDAVRRSAPLTAPLSWRAEASLTAPDRIVLDLIIPGMTAEKAKSISFYCYDMQVDSDEAQRIEFIPEEGATNVRLHLSRPDVAPRSPSHFAGVLHSPDWWPGLETHHVEISLPWPPGTFPNE